MQKKASGHAGKEAAPAPIFSQNALEVLLPDPLMEYGGHRDSRLVVVFRSENAGEGDPVVGRILMAEYLQALLDHPEPPQALLFYHSAVQLVLEDSPFQDHVRKIASRGTEILACRTSLQLLAPGQQPCIGRAVPLATLIDRMRQASQVLWP
jgi:hypothetical protein